MSRAREKNIDFRFILREMSPREREQKLTFFIVLLRKVSEGEGQTGGLTFARIDN